ncbi:MAG: sigma factor-like helix-turn-helix DNA-binding protein [Bryobacteraceae bacterium]
MTYHAELFSFLCGVIGDDNESDRIAVEAFAQVHALGYKHHISDTPVAELYRIAIRESARRLCIGSQTGRDEQRQSLWQILMQLNENERLLLLLREVARYSIPQIAACLRVSEEQVRSRLLGARQSFAGSHSAARLEVRPAD